MSRGDKSSYKLKTTIYVLYITNKLPCSHTTSFQRQCDVVLTLKRRLVSVIIVFITISNLFSVGLTITFTKQCKANSRQPEI